jgi:glucuronate isomerase
VRAFFALHGATATDLVIRRRPRSIFRARRKRSSRRRSRAPRRRQAERFRGQMLVEMAKMSLDDGLVMQIHPGSFRNHNPSLLRAFGRDKGADIPTRTEYVRAETVADRFGNDGRLTIILFTLDDTTYARARALAGHALRFGWVRVVVLRQPRACAKISRARHRDGGFNTVGFNDDTAPSRRSQRATTSRDASMRIPRLVAEHRLDEDEARGDRRSLVPAREGGLSLVAGSAEPFGLDRRTLVEVFRSRKCCWCLR